MGLPPIAARWVRLPRHACTHPSAVVTHLIVRLHPVAWGNSHAGANDTCATCRVMTNHCVLVDLLGSGAVMLTVTDNDWHRMAEGCQLLAILLASSRLPLHGIAEGAAMISPARGLRGAH